MPRMYKVTQYKAVREVKIYEADSPGQALRMAKNNVDEWEEEREIVEGYRTQELVE